MSLPTLATSDICLSSIHNLMGYCKSGENEDFAKRAIESLVKKLKEKHDQLESLTTAITTEGTQPTMCVTIPRTQDGRLQVAAKKGFPHVIYSRIWRWPDVHKNELRHLKFCQFAFDLKQDDVCVNPYHYERIISPGIGDSHVEEDFNREGPELCDNDEAGIIAAENMPALPNAFEISSTYVMPVNSVYSLLVPSSQLNLSDSSYSASDQPSAIQIQHGDTRPLFLTGNTTVPAHIPQASSNNDNLFPLNLPLPEYWCSITYFELDQQVGGTYKVPSSCCSITVDGYTNPSSPNRFCLGQLSNVHRTERSEKARMGIGKGVKFEFVGEGDVWLHCLGGHPIFMQSDYLDKESGRYQEDVVHKIHQDSCIKVFDLHQCCSQLRQKVAASRQSASASSNASESARTVPSISLDDLRRLCTLRLSLINSWGADFQLKYISDTACWIEVQLNRPLQFLDVLLQTPLCGEDI